MTVAGAVDVAVIGAGLAGLICAQQLQQAGYSVVVVEKSRGLGGRLATRRLQNTCADHGVRYLSVQGSNFEGSLSRHLIQALLTSDVIQPWTNKVLKVHLPSELSASRHQDWVQVEPYYAAEQGLTAVAKFLAVGLDIRRGQRVQSLEATSQVTSQWQLRLETIDAESTPPLLARSLVMAIPAPQALMLLEPLSESGLPLDLIQQVRSVQFDPCITAIATYPAERQAKLKQLPWTAATFADSPSLAWLSIENTKRPAEMPVLVAQSTATFAAQHLEASDLKPVGQQLLDAAANLVAWLDSPTELQVHRWRYAFVRQPLSDFYLSSALPLPLVCSGDWCGGSQIENALESGLAAACQISQLLADRAKTTIDKKNSFHELMHRLAAPSI